MDEVIRFLKQHKRQILKYGKKAFTWWKKNQNKPSGGQGAGQSYGGYAAAAGAGAAGGAAAAHSGWGQSQAPPPQGQYHVPQMNSQAPTQGPHYKYSADNQVNQHDSQYMDLRNRARAEGDAMSRCFDQAHAAHERGDGAKAKQLSTEGHQHKEEMQRLNKQAADWIFMANNEDSPVGTVDLHGLYTSEALERTEQAVRNGQAQGWNEMRFIVGKGLHSKDHRQHIAPAVEKLMRDYRLDAHIDPKNTGVLVVNLRGSGGGGANFTRDLAKQASGDENECVIM